MAHRSNVIPVTQDIPRRDDVEQTVVDPVCGMEISRSESRNMVFRPDVTYYFCSKECQEEFLHPTKRGVGRAKAA